MNVKATLALVLLAGTAGLWFFKGDAWAPGLGIRPAHTEPAPSTAAATLESLNPAGIARVEVAFPGGASLVLERAATDSGWKLPGNWPLRRPEVEELADTLGTLRTRFQAIPIDGGPDLGRFGLADEQKPLVVKLTTDRRLVTLTFGEPKPAAGETEFTRPAYVRVDDTPEVFRLGPDVMRVLRRPPEAYRRRSLYPDVERVMFAGGPAGTPFGGPPGDAPTTVALPGEETGSIRVSRNGPKVWNIDLSPGFSFTLVRTGKLPEPAVFTRGSEPAVQPDRLADAWALAGPARDRAAPARLRGVLSAVADLWAESFADSEAHDVRLAAARLAPIPLDPLAGVVRLLPLPADVRTGLAGSAESVTVTRRGGEPVTVRFGGVAKVAEREEMMTVPGGPPGAPPRTIPNKVHTLYRFARVDGNPLVFTVAADKLADLFASVPSLVDPRVVRVERDEVREIVLRPAGRPEIRLTLTKGDTKGARPEERQDRWFLAVKPNPLPADSARVNELLDRLDGFRAEGADRVFYPDDPPAAETRITVVTRDKRPEGEPDGPRRELTLLVGKPDHAARRLPVRFEGWPRVTLADNTLGPDDPDAWITGVLFPNTVSDLLGRPALAYRDRKLFDAAAELASVSVEGRFALRRESGDWKLTAPVTSEADPGKAGELAATLAGLSATDYLLETPSAEDLKSFGLQAAAHTARLEFRGGRSYTLELGGPRPGKSEVFARLDGGAVFGLPNTVVEQLTTGVVGLLPLRVWAARPETITSLEVVRGDAPSESFRLTRGGGDWQLSGPFAAPVPSANARQFVSSLGTLTAVKYQTLATTNPAEYGLDKPLLTVKLVQTEPNSTGGAEVPVTTSVAVGGPVPDGSGRYARLDSPNAPVFVVPGAFVAAAQTSPLDLLDRTLLSLDPARVAKVRVAPEKAEDAFTLSKDAAGNWSAEGITFAVDPERIDRLTSAAARPPVTRIAAYGDSVKWAEYGLDKPEVTVTVTLTGEKPETHIVALGNRDALGGRFARVDGGKAVAVLPTSAAEALARKRFEYADRTLLTFDPTTLVGLTRRQGKDELELAPAAAIGWDIVKPAKHKADQPFVDELAEALGRLRADRVAAYGLKEQVFKDHGLDPPAASITVTVGEKAEQKTLRIGSHVNAVAVDGDRYAVVETANAEVIVGVLPAALVKRLLAHPVAFRDRSLGRFVDADRAVLERGDRKVAFAKVGVTWRVTEPVSAEAESAELESLVADLGKLRADTWVGEKKGADLKAFGLDRPAAKWTLSNGDSTVLVLLLGKPAEDGRVHVTTDKGELVGLLDARLTTRVLAEYRQRKVWDLDAAQAGEVEVTAPSGKFTLEKEGAAWRDPAKPGEAIDAAAVNDLLGTLAGLRAERYAADAKADPKLFGLDKPEFSVAVTSAGIRRVLEVGGAVGGTGGKERYARVGDKDRTDVFVLSGADVARLTRDRSAYAMKK